MRTLYNRRLCQLHILTTQHLNILTTTCIFLLIYFTIDDFEFKTKNLDSVQYTYLSQLVTERSSVLKILVALALNCVRKKLNKSKLLSLDLIEKIHIVLTAEIEDSLGEVQNAHDRAKPVVKYVGKYTQPWEDIFTIDLKDSVVVLNLKHDNKGVSYAQKSIILCVLFLIFLFLIGIASVTIWSREMGSQLLGW